MIQTLVLALLAAGYPGPESRADYTMRARLLPDSNLVLGRSRIEFTNGSGLETDTLWIHLYPNAYRDHTTAFGQDLEAVGRYGFRASDDSGKGWVDLSDWTLNREPVNVEVDGSLGFIPLATPLSPESTVVLEGDFILHVPVFWSRLGRSGDTYQITQWYPKMCVLDENGWHRGRYHWRGEFYSDYGDYTVILDVPEDFQTAATGRITAEEVSEDSTRRIETWQALNVHDFVWAASPDYTIREHTYNYPSEMGSCSVKVHLVLLSDDPEHWSDVPAIIDSTLLYYGEWYCPYPYPDLWVVEPAVLMAGGMEYPQFVFSGAHIPLTRALEMVTSHEVGHQWFYGILGNDEVNEAWLDEGMNTFSELRYMERRHGFSGNMSRTPDWLLNVSDQELNLVTYATGAAGEERVPVLSDATDAGDGSHPTGFTYYSKPAFFLRMLRRQMGDEDFDEAMSIYFERFSFHHPHTDDFQAIVEEVTGRSWQEEFDYWLLGTGSLDLRLSSFEVIDDSTRVTLDGDIPHALTADLALISSGDTLLAEVELKRDGEVSVTVPGEWDIAVADPFHLLPDRRPWNNSSPPMWNAAPMLLPFPKPAHHNLWYLPFPSYAAGSWRAELLLLSAPVTSFQGGPWTWTAYVSVPFVRNGYSDWGGSFNVPLLRRWRRSLYLNLGMHRGYGKGTFSTSLSYLMGGRVPADPHSRISLKAELTAVEDTRVYGSNNIQEGKGVEVTGSFSATDENYRLSWETGLSGMVSPGFSGSAYGRLEGELELTTRLTGGYLVRTRLYCGRVLGDAPVQTLLRPGGGLFAGGIMGAFIPPDGWLSPREHYYVRSGPALPGYSENPLRARAALTMEQRLPLPNPFLPMEVYASGGWLADGFSGFNGDSFVADAGLALRIAMLEVIFPLWVSDPAGAEESFQFRWRLGLSPEGFPDLY